MTTGILWDNDGVLVDTERLYLQATREVMATIGVDLTDALYLELFLAEGRGAWHLASARGVTDDEIVRLKKQRDDRYASLLEQQQEVIDGVADVLSSLHGRYRMGIVTSSQRSHFELAHRHSGLLGYFDFVVASGDYTHYKPHPEPYLVGLRKLGLPAGECVAVEDSERGLIAATAAGLRCFVVPTSLTRQCSFRDAHKVLQSVRDLAQELA